MNKNRILCLLLSLMMLFSIVAPTTIFAEEEVPAEPEVVEEYEEVQEDPPVVEEPAPIVEETPVVEEVQETPTGEPTEEPSEEPVGEIVAADEPTTEESSEEPAAEPAEEPVEEVPAEPVEEPEAEVPADEEELFSQGYVRFAVPTYVYEFEYWQNKIGILPADAVVYAEVSTYAENTDDSWLYITFDTAEARDADSELLTGYVQLKDVTVLSDEEVDQLIAQLSGDHATRNIESIMIPAVAYQAIESITIVEEAYISPITATTTNTESATVTATAEKDAVQLGETVNITATCENTVGEVSYRWQYRNNTTEAIGYSGMTGNRTATLSFEANASRLAYSYRCEVKDSNGTWYSNWVTITKEETPAEFIIESIVYSVLEGNTNVTVKRYDGTQSAITIPSEVTFDEKVYMVTEIGEEAFYNNTMLTSISLPNTVQIIRTRAFSGCINLSSMSCHD